MPVSGVRNVVILGSTGSIGRQAADVIGAHRDRFRVVGLSAGRDQAGLARQAAELGVSATGVGAEAAVALAALPQADIVLNAIVGAAGLRASIAALEAGKTLALANKESLVAGGEACLAAARRSGAAIVPVDSEHAALAQCLEGRDPESVARLVITASGGPFRTRADLEGVTPADALAHPTWSMGPKITVDSATLMNKGLEAIEAHHLFGVSYDRVGVVVHPQSLVHGIVELVDGTTLLQAAPTDMRIPIQAALSYPDRLESGFKSVDLVKVGSLEFTDVDNERFPSLAVAFEAGRRGGTYPAALNAANEVAVAAFLEGRIAFTDIVPVVEGVVEKHESGSADLDGVLAADAWARSTAAAVIDRRSVTV